MQPRYILEVIQEATSGGFRMELRGDAQYTSADQVIHAARNSIKQGRSVNIYQSEADLIAKVAIDTSRSS